MLCSDLILSLAQGPKQMEFPRIDAGGSEEPPPGELGQLPGLSRKCNRT